MHIPQKARITPDLRFDTTGDGVMSHYKAVLTLLQEVCTMLDESRKGITFIPFSDHLINIDKMEHEQRVFEYQRQQNALSNPKAN